LRGNKATCGMSLCYATRAIQSDKSLTNGLMTEQEKTLIAGCLRMDKAAWDQFVQQYSNFVYHTIRKTLTLHHTESRDEAVEELYQEFFISILQNNCRN
jgi:hypothetical protein